MQYGLDTVDLRLLLADVIENLAVIVEALVVVEELLDGDVENTQLILGDRDDLEDVVVNRLGQVDFLEGDLAGDLLALVGNVVGALDDGNEAGAGCGQEGRLSKQVNNVAQLAVGSGLCIVDSGLERGQAIEVGTGKSVLRKMSKPARQLTTSS